MSPFSADTPGLLARRTPRFVGFRRSIWAGKLPYSHYSQDKWHIGFDPVCKMTIPQRRRPVVLAKVTAVPMSNGVAFHLEAASDATLAP